MKPTEKSGAEDCDDYRQRTLLPISVKNSEFVKPYHFIKQGNTLKVIKGQLRFKRSAERLFFFAFRAVDRENLSNSFYCFLGRN